jgi:hypothetical protein
MAHSPVAKLFFFAWLAVSSPTLVAPILGCSSGPTFSQGLFRDEEASYRVGLLNTKWERVYVSGRNDLAWLNEKLDAIIQVNASCNPSMDVPLKALTNHLLIGFTERNIQEQKLLPMAGRETLRTHLTAKLDGVPREMVLDVLKKDGCVYDFSVVTPPGSRFAPALQDYLGLIAGFRSNQ